MARAGAAGAAGVMGVGVRDGQPARLIEQDSPWDVSRHERKWASGREESYEFEKKKIITQRR